MKKILIALTVTVVTVVFLVWFFSPEQVVKRRTGELLSTLTLAQGDGKAARQMSALKLGDLIGDELVLETPTIEEANGTHQKTEIESGFAVLTRMADFTKFEIVDYHTITVDGDTARVNAAIEAVVVLPSYRPADGMYEVELDWQKGQDGKWRLTRARWQEPK